MCRPRRIGAPVRDQIRKPCAVCIDDVVNAHRLPGALPDLPNAGHRDMGDFQDPIVAPDGEYEWLWEIPAENVPALCRLLDIAPDADVLDELAAHWSHAASAEMERRVRKSGLAQLWVL